MTTTLTATGIVFNDGSYFDSVAPAPNAINSMIIGCVTFTAPAVSSGTPYATSYYGTYYTVAGGNLYMYNNYFTLISPEITSSGQACPVAGNLSGSWRSNSYVTVSGVYGSKATIYYWPLIPYYRYA